MYMRPFTYSFLHDDPAADLGVLMNSSPRLKSISGALNMLIAPEWDRPR